MQCMYRLQGMLGKDPVEVAQFLTKTSGLEKSVIGEYLGEREDMALKVMHAYVDAMDFTGLDFDAAIRCEDILVQHGHVSLSSWPSSPFTDLITRAAQNMCHSNSHSNQDSSPEQYLVLQAVSGWLPSARRGAEDRPADGEVCGAFRALQP